MSHQSPLIESDIHAYLKQHERKDLLRFITCGSVDDGKSTLIGRLLHDSQLIYEDQLAAVTKDSGRFGTTGDEPDLALLVDGLQSEREQGITIDVAYRYFSTDKRKFIIADTPGPRAVHPQHGDRRQHLQPGSLLIDAARACCPRPSGTPASSRCWASAPGRGGEQDGPGRLVAGRFDAILDEDSRRPRQARR